MAYIKNNWVDREGTTRYFETVDSDGAKIFTPDYTQVTELGTPVNAVNMNHIEEGIAAGSFTKFDLNTTYGKNDLVTVIENGSPVIYKSLVDNNIGNALSGSIAWEKISLGGGGGLEIGDIGFTQMAIDETKGKRRVLNGQVIIQEQYVQFTNIIKESVALNPSLVCTEAEWQTAVTMSTNGVCEKFVIDDEAGTIRLPKYPTYLDLTNNTSSVAAKTQTVSVNGNGKALRLTTSSGTGNWAYSTSGSWHMDIDKNSSTVSNTTVNTTISSCCPNGARIGVATSNSGLTGSVTIPAIAGVTSEKIKGTYFIQVATGAETEDNIVNEIELNNPFFLGMSQYFETAPNNISWLKSEGQWNAKAVYPTVYNWALINANNGIEGFKLVTDTYTDYDYVINTTDETFRLPLLNGSEDLPSDRYEDLTLEASGTTYTAPANGFVTFEKELGGTKNEYITIYSNIKSEVRSVDGRALATYLPVSVNQSYTVSYSATGATTMFRFIYAQGNGSLYFYVGETVQNANLINAGRIQEKVAECITRMDCPAYIVETYVNGTSWYRVYSDGWKEQGGIISVAAYTTSTTSTVTFLKPFANANYSAVLQVANGGNSWAKISTNSTSRTATTMVAAEYQTDGTGASIAAHKLIWYAYGY